MRAKGSVGFVRGYLGFRVQRNWVSCGKRLARSCFAERLSTASRYDLLLLAIRILIKLRAAIRGPRMKQHFIKLSD